MTIQANDQLRPVTKHRALSFFGSLILYFALMLFGELHGLIQGVMAFVLSSYLIKDLTGLSASSALFDSDSEIRAKLSARKEKA